MSGLSRLYRSETEVDFVGRRRLWFIISGAVILLSAIRIGGVEAESPCAGSLKGLNCGIEFKGGLELKAPIPDDGPLASASDTDVTSEIRSALSDFGASNAQIQVATQGGQREVLVQTKEIADPEAQESFRNEVASAVGVDVSAIDSQRIGQKWGQQITEKALRALIIFLLVILAFISWRFEWKMGVAAIAALAHDLIITAGVYAFVGFEVTPSTVIAILTILGYSLYDTVVIFDRVDENVEQLATTGKMTYEGAANLAMNKVLMRSLNTSLTTLLPVGALLFVGTGLLGAGTLKDLSLALLVGILAGTYSSIFVATPLLSMLKEGEPRYKTVREKVLRDAARRGRAAPVKQAASGVASTTAEAPADPDVAESESEAAPGTRRPPPARSPARARVGSKKKKRRKKR